MNPRWIVRLYPWAWRNRYGVEFERLLWDQLADGSAGRWWWVNPAFHAVRARLAGPSATRVWPPVLFAWSAVSIWSQLAVGWQWAAPLNVETRFGMLLMSVGLLLAVLGGAIRVWSVDWRTRSAAMLLISTAALLGGALYVGRYWPGGIGHQWSGRDLVPVPLARVAWAATLAVSTYWAHPHALARLGSLQLGWMVVSLIPLTAIALSAARLTRRPAGRRSQLAITGMGLFLIGALSWSLWGAAGPHGLYAPGEIDLLLVAAATIGLRGTMRARAA